MAITAVGSYSSVYENTYEASRKEAAKNVETRDTARSSKEEYLKNLQKQVPYMKLQIGYGLNTKNDGKVNIVDVNPKLLEKMQNDPQAAREYTQRLKDVESAMKWADNYHKSAGSTVIVRHDYIDENGNLSHFAISVRKDALNEKLRKEAQENAEKQIEKSRENARKKTERLSEQLEEKAEEAKDKGETLLTEKIGAAKDGKIFLDNEDMQTIIAAAKKENQGKADNKKPVSPGTNFAMPHRNFHGA